MSLDSRLAATVEDGRVRFSYTAINQGTGPLTLTFPDAGRVDVTVEDGEAEVWSSSAGSLFAQVIGKRTIDPGEQVRYEVTWEDAPPGTYRAVGDVRARSRSAPAETTVTV